MIEDTCYASSGFQQKATNMAQTLCQSVFRYSTRKGHWKLSSPPWLRGRAGCPLIGKVGCVSKSLDKILNTGLLLVCECVCVNRMLWRGSTVSLPMSRSAPLRGICVRMRVWLREFGTCCKALWVVGRLERNYKNAFPFTKTAFNDLY